MSKFYEGGRIVEPIPETLEALKELTKYGDTEVATELHTMGSRVEEVVPEIMGLSLTLIDDGLTFTLVSSNKYIAGLDAVQYLDGGPCINAVHEQRTIPWHESDPLDENQWQLFARSVAAAGIASTLSLPIMRNERVVGSVNLYASTRDAFDGHHEELARRCGAWAPGVVSNADLSFSSRLAALEAPDRLRGQDTVDQALGIISTAQHIDITAATERLREAAARAGISETQAAAAIIGLLAGADGGL
jgi:transcriptional regulator with GAF, ATPase, and Fis domain